MRAPLVALALNALLPACGPPAVGPYVPGGGLPSLEPTLSSIQSLVLTPRCATCHSGSGIAPDLTDGASFASLVNVPSSEGTLLVSPGVPQDSELLLRVQPSGARPMPPGDRLSDAEVQAISDWIFNGAQDD
jgi:hypothetical protein